MYGRQARKTASLEAYNCALNERIKTRGLFYGFALVLVDEEFIKHTELNELIESGAGSGRREN